MSQGTMLLNQGGPNKEVGAQQAQLGSCPPAGRRARRERGRGLQAAQQEASEMSPPRAWRGRSVVRDGPGVGQCGPHSQKRRRPPACASPGATCPPPQQPSFPFCEAGLMVPSSAVR